MTWLFDVNALIAIGDPGHLFHNSIHTWLGRHKGETWATCPVTENGFVRILSHPGYRGGPVCCADAIAILAGMKSAAGWKHVFWPDDVSVTDSQLISPHVLAGPKQLTDVYLAVLALRNKGRLVTYDRKVAWQAVMGGMPDLLLNPDDSKMAVNDRLTHR